MQTPPQGAQSLIQGTGDGNVFTGLDILYVNGRCSAKRVHFDAAADQGHTEGVTKIDNVDGDLIDFVGHGGQREAQQSPHPLRGGLIDSVDSNTHGGTRSAQAASFSRPARSALSATRWCNRQATPPM